MSKKTLVLKPLVLATLIAISTSATAEITIPQNPTLSSTISDQFDQLNFNLDVNCDGSDQGCKKYTGTESDLFQQNILARPNDYFQNQSNAYYDNVLSPFYENTSGQNSSDKTLIVTSFNNVNNFVFAYSNHNGNSNVMPDVSASANRLLIDLGDSQWTSTVNYEGPADFNSSNVPSIAAVGNAQGGAIDNQLIIQNSAFTTQAGFIANAAFTHQQKNSVDGNIALIDTVKIEKGVANSINHIGASWIMYSDQNFENSNNVTWIESSDLEVDLIYSAKVNSGAWNTAKKNVTYINASNLTIDSSQSLRGIFSSSTNANAEQNWLEIQDTEITITGTQSTYIGSAYMAKKAINNTTIIRGDSNIQSSANLYVGGGFANARYGNAQSITAATENKVLIGGSQDNRVKLSANSLGIYGGMLMFSGDTSLIGQANKNTIAIENADIGKAGIYGGYYSGTAKTAEVTFNTVNIENSTFSSSTSIYGAFSANGNTNTSANNNTVTIGHNSSFEMLSIYGGRTQNGTAIGNTVMLSDTIVNGELTVYGGKITGTSGGTASGNHVIIGENVTGKDNGLLTANTIVGGTVSVNVDGNSYNQFVLDENRLTTSSTFQTKILGGFQHYEFIVNADTQPGNAIISVTGSMPVILQTTGDIQSTVAVGGTGLDLSVGTTYTLIDSNAGFSDLDGNTLTAADELNGLKQDLVIKSNSSLVRIESNELNKDSYDLTLDETGQNLNITITDKSSSADIVNPETDVLMQASIASLASLFAADDLLVDTALKSRNNSRLDGPFAAMRAGTWSHDATSRFETDVYSGLLGWALHASDVEFGPFIEMGRGNYKMDDGASGHHNYVGAGIYANWETPFYVRLTGYLKGGAMENNFETKLVGQSFDFDNTSAYWGAHIGANVDINVTEKLRARPFVSYFYDGRESETFTKHGGVVDGSKFDFDTINAHRVQVGSMFEYAYTDTSRPYFGITYEQVIKAEAEGAARDAQGKLSLNSSDVEGATGIISAGWSYLNSQKDFEFNFGVNGYAGARNGVSAQMGANWFF